MAVIDNLTIRFVTNAAQAARDMDLFAKAAGFVRRNVGSAVKAVAGMTVFAKSASLVREHSLLAAPALLLVGQGLEGLGAGRAVKAGRALTLVAGAMDLIGLAKSGGRARSSLSSISLWLIRIATFAIPGGALIKVLGAGSLIAGFFGTRSAIRGINRSLAETLEIYDRLAKVGRKLNISTDQLAGLRFATQQTAGINTTQFDNAMQRMVRRVSEAHQGTGEAVKALRELQLDAGRLAEMAPDQQFLAIADAMKQVKNQGDQIRLTQKLFDTEGVELVNSLRLGSAEMQRLTRQARSLGLAPSTADTRMIESYNDQIARTSSVWKSVRREAWLAILPTMKLSSRLWQEIGQVTNVFAKFGRTVVQTSLWILTGPVRALIAFKDGIGSLRIVVAAHKWINDTLQSWWNSAKKWLDPIIQKIRELQKLYQDFKNILFVPNQSKPISVAVQPLLPGGFSRPELAARRRGDINTFAASRRNLSDMKAPLESLVEVARDQRELLHQIARKSKREEESFELS